MLNECSIKKIGTSKHLRVPFQLLREYKLDRYVYLVEVQNDGKTIIYRRMREKEEDKK